MGTAMLSAAAWLSRVLAAENAALLALDIPAAAALLQDKLAAAHGLSVAAAEAGRSPTRLSSRGTPEAAGLALQLRDLAEENRRLLERAVLVQGRVLDMVARAASRGAAQASGRYGPGSAAVPERGPMALHMRA